MAVTSSSSESARRSVSWNGAIRAGSASSSDRAGEKSAWQRHSGAAAARAIASGRRMASRFGAISPKRSSRVVAAAIETSEAHASSAGMDRTSE